MAYEYFIEFWGPGEPELSNLLGKPDRRFWFTDRAAYDKLLDLIDQMNKDGHQISYRSTAGQLTHKRTMALIGIEYQKHVYCFPFDMGYEVPFDNARITFESGNYACDCNRSMMLRGMGYDFPQLDCGKQVHLRTLEFKALP